jgi:hypothetical protein
MARVELFWGSVSVGSFQPGHEIRECCRIDQVGKPAGNGKIYVVKWLRAKKDFEEGAMCDGILVGDYHGVP